MENISSSSCSASNDDYDDEPLPKKLHVLLNMPQNAPEYAPKHLRLPKISLGGGGGEHPP